MDDTIISQIPIKEILETWVKFGTVFLIHHIGLKCLNGNTNAGLSMKLGIFVLLGFTLYLALIKPFVPLNTNKPVLAEVSNDILFFGTGLLAANILYSLVNQTEIKSSNLKSIVYVLFGFIVYDMLFYNFVPKDDSPRSTAIKDIVKFGTMMIIAQMIMDRSFTSVQTVEFMSSLLLVLGGFAFYDFVIKKVIIIK